MYKLLALNKISPVGLNQLSENYSVSEDEKNPDGILLRSYNMHDMELNDNLKAVARCGAGVNNIPVEKCAEKGIVVFNTPGANANAVKELVITSLLISSRKIVDGYNWVQSLNGQDGIAGLVEKGKSKFVGPEISGKTLGVIGLGAIGVLVANAAIALGMEVYGFDPYLSVNAAWSLDSHVKKAKSLDAIYENCDYITVHVPLTNDTKGMFCKETFNKVKKGVRIINLSRGDLVNNADMKEALSNGTVQCYVTDFPDNDIVGVENVITVPHLGASTPEAEDNCAVMAAIEIQNFLENGNIKNSVNFPSCSLPSSDLTRICIIHKNTPNVVGSVTGILGDKKINIDNMINKSKGNYAYTMIDVDCNADKIDLDSLNSINGVIRVRIITQ